jgi:hypothetical protein
MINNKRKLLKFFVLVFFYPILNIALAQKNEIKIIKINKNCWFLSTDD